MMVLTRHVLFNPISVCVTLLSRVQIIIIVSAFNPIMKLTDCSALVANTAVIELEGINKTLLA